MDGGVLSADIKELHPLVLQLAIADQRESALLELSKKRENYPDLAPVLWHSYGTIAALLQEIISVYPMLSPPTLTPHASNRVCNALALLQCVASHAETKSRLMSGKCCCLLVVRPFFSGVMEARWREEGKNSPATLLTHHHPLPSTQPKSPCISIPSSTRCRGIGPLSISA